MITHVNEYKRDKQTGTERYRDTKHVLTASGDSVTVTVSDKDGKELTAMYMTPEEAIRFGSDIISAAVTRLPYYRTY